MYPRTEYEMSEGDLKVILEACKPTPVISFNGINSIGGTPQENANNAWEKLSKKMGFDHMTVRPDNKGDRFFTAIPSETKAQREVRETREADEAKGLRIVELKEEISIKSKELKDLENDNG